MHGNWKPICKVNRYMAYFSSNKPLDECCYLMPLTETLHISCGNRFTEKTIVLIDDIGTKKTYLPLTKNAISRDSEN